VIHLGVIHLVPAVKIENRQPNVTASLQSDARQASSNHSLRSGKWQERRSSPAERHRLSGGAAGDSQAIRGN
jgi:hypothetical protein